jgi:hypothetical protein
MAAKGELTAEAPATAGKLRRGDAEKKIGHRWGTDSHRWAEPQINADKRRFKFFSPPEDTGDFMQFPVRV